MRLFHYTVGVSLVEIVKEKQISLAKMNLPSTVKPAVWFTTKMTWEKTCNKAIRWKDGTEKDLNEKETEEAGRGLFRIEVDPKAVPHTWRDYKKLSGEDPRFIRALEKTAKIGGARPEIEWKISFEPVGIEHWFAIEKWNGSIWELKPERR